MLADQVAIEYRDWTPAVSRNFVIRTLAMVDLPELEKSGEEIVTPLACDGAGSCDAIPATTSGT